MLYFKNRSLARAFAKRAGRKVKDFGADAPKRWAVTGLFANRATVRFNFKVED